MRLKELSSVIAGAQEVVLEYVGNGKKNVNISTSVLDELLEEDSFPLLDGDIVGIMADDESRLRIRLCSDFPQEYLKSDLFFLELE